MSNKKFVIVCVAAIMFNASINTLVGVNELKSTDATQEEHVEIPKSKYDPEPEQKKEASVASEPSVSEASEPAVQNITVNGDYYNNSNVTINNDADEKTKEEDTITEKEEEAVKEKKEVVEEQETIEEKKPDPNNNSEIMTARRERGVLILGDPADDINPQEDVICVENIKCPKCGEHTYKETYNKNNINCYLGRCSTCYYEQ